MPASCCHFYFKTKGISYFRKSSDIKGLGHLMKLSKKCYMGAIIDESLNAIFLLTKSEVLKLK